MAFSEQMKGNQNARKNKYDSVVLRIPGAFVESIHKCIQKERMDTDLPIARADVLEYALSALARQLEEAGFPPLVRHVLLEDEEILNELDADEE